MAESALLVVFDIQLQASDTFQCQCQLIYAFSLSLSPSLSFIIVNFVYAVVELIMSHLYVEMKQ